MWTKKKKKKKNSFSNETTDLFGNIEDWKKHVFFAIPR